MLEEHLRLLAAPDHPLAKRTVFQLEDFHGEVFLTNEKGCPYRTMFDRSFEKEGIDSINGLLKRDAAAEEELSVGRQKHSNIPDMVSSMAVNKEDKTPFY